PPRSYPLSLHAALPIYPLASRLAFAQGLIREAGALAAGYFAQLDSLVVEKKGARDMLSEADLATEKLIRDKLAAAFPTDGFLGRSEEHTSELQSRGHLV